MERAAEPRGSACIREYVESSDELHRGEWLWVQERIAGLLDSDDGRSLFVAGGSDLERAWAGIHDTVPPGWYVGTLVYHVERREWALYVFDTTEKAHIGKRSREWTAVAPTEEGVVRQMARCLREIREGKAPK